MALIEFAKHELEEAGLFDKDSDYGGMLGEAVLELIDVFARQGHSGFSAGIVSDIFNKLSRYKPITPITNNPKDWNFVTDDTWQSRKQPDLFSNNNGKTYYSVDDPKRELQMAKEFVLYPKGA